MTDHFASPKQLISHARDEIKDAEQLVTQFIGAQRYTNVVDEDHQAKQRVYKIRVEGPSVPDKLANIAKDACGNLRDALDHAVYAATVAIQGGTPKNTGFPFADTEAGVRGELASKRLSGNAPEIRPLLETFRPYKGGNAALWALNQIRNPNTHRFIVPVGAAHQMGSLHIGSAMIGGNSQIGYSHWDAAKNEIEYMRLGINSTMNAKVSPSIKVVLEGIDAVSGKDLISSLNFMAAEVDKVLSAIQTRTAIIVTNKP